MRIKTVFVSLIMTAGGIGCGGGSTGLNTAPLSEEQKRQIAAEDKRIEDEESPKNNPTRKKGR